MKVFYSLGWARIAINICKENFPDPNATRILGALCLASSNEKKNYTIEQIGWWPYDALEVS